jgi:hypothetical protein
VDNLVAHVNLNAAVGTLVSLQVGVDVSIQKVNLTIQDVEAEVQLVARIGNIVAIINRTMDTLDKNPNLLSVFFFFFKLFIPSPYF